MPFWFEYHVMVMKNTWDQGRQDFSELVRRIIEATHPLRIILFGSAARGQIGANSDLDVLVVVPDGVHRRKTAQIIYRHLVGFGFATDVIVATEGDLAKHGRDQWRIYQNALTEGKELYHAVA